MPKMFNLRGFTVIVSLSHGLLGPLKQRLDVLLQARPGASPQTLAGMAEIIGGFPDPNRTILAGGCTRQALFDEDLPPEDRTYREIFGERIMTEVRSYVQKIPGNRVSFRPEDEPPGDPAALAARIEAAFVAAGQPLDEPDRVRLADLID